MTSGDGGRRASVNIDTLNVSDGGRGVHINLGAKANRLSTLPNDRRDAPFTGRKDELKAIDRALAGCGRAQVVVLHGSPGIGKTRLAVEYGLQRREQYPGGAFFVRLDHTPPPELAQLARLLGLPAYPDEPIEQQCRRVLAHLGQQPTLLIYDNVAGEKILDAWLPPGDAACHVLATSTYGYWPTPWTTVPVEPFPDGDARQLVSRLITAKDAANRFANGIVAKARGVTVELCAVAKSVEYEVRHGREGAIRAALTPDTESSFGSAWRLLSEDAQLLLKVACLFVVARVLPDALRALFTKEGWQDVRLNDALDAILDRGLLKSAGEAYEVHALMAQFVNVQAAPEVSAALSRRHFEAFAQAARRFAEQPSEAEHGGRFLAYPAEIRAWEAAVSRDTIVAHATDIGNGLVEGGRFVEALPWFQRVVEVAQNGHRAVLARLRPENPTYVSFLARVLAGEELPLEPEERRVWVFAWLMAAAVGDTSTHFGLVHFARNAEAIEAAWKTVCEAMLTNQSVSSALRTLILAETASSTAVKRDPTVNIPEPNEAIGPFDGPKKWATAARVPLEPLFGAAKLVAVMYSRSPTLAKLPLARIAETVPLFSALSTLQGVPLPTPLWEALNLWEYQEPRLRAAMRLRTSLTWICVDPSEDYQITFLARWGKHASGSFESWQQDAFRKGLQVERIFHGAAVAFDSAGMPSTLVDVAAERARVAREISEWLRSGIRHNLSFANKYDAPSRPLFLLRLAQTETLGPASEDLLGSIRRRGITAKDGPVHRALVTLAGRAVFSPADRTVVMSAVSLEVLNETLGTPGDVLRRADIQALRRDLASPTAMAATLSPPLRERAAREWQELLDSPGSPLLMLDAALSREWSVLNLHTEAAVRALDALARCG